jgi:pimeloyl-ACP methyl ester carboxylesterase
VDDHLVAVRLEVLHRSPDGVTTGIPVVLVHGICHGAWCWERYLDHFAEAGHEVFAVSLRGHAGSEGRERLDTFGMADYVDDVRSVTASLDGRPALVGHSMGGAVVQRYLADDPSDVAAAVLLAPATSGGLGATRPGGRGLLGMPLRNSPAGVLTAIRTAQGKPVTPAAQAGSPFFGGRLPPEDVARYAPMLQAESKRVISDLRRPYGASTSAGVPVMVIGSAADAWFDTASLRRTAKAYGVQPVVLPRLCHDMMLDPEWRLAADRILAFLRPLSARGSA